MESECHWPVIGAVDIRGQFRHSRFVIWPTMLGLLLVTRRSCWLQRQEPLLLRSFLSFVADYIMLNFNGTKTCHCPVCHHYHHGFLPLSQGLSGHDVSRLIHIYLLTREVMH